MKEKKTNNEKEIFYFYYIELFYLFYFILFIYFIFMLNHIRFGFFLAFFRLLAFFVSATLSWAMAPPSLIKKIPFNLII